jgi:sporulation protein YlmC with PRC-barrel domain
MKKLSDLKKMEVVSADGHVVGKAKSVIITDKWVVNGLSIKIKKDALEILGKKKPLFSSLYLDVDIKEIKGVKDKVVLRHLMKDLGTYLLSHNEKYDAERLIDLEVLGTGGKVVGKVEDMKIDVNLWTMPSLVIKIRKDALKMMKMNKCLISDTQLNISMYHVVDIGDYVMLEVSAENIGQILENISIKKE